MKARFVAEVCSNHVRRAGEPDLERALAFVDSASELGCAAVKFQQFRIRDLFAREALQAHPELRERERWELPESFNAEIAARARAKGIAFASTPFYLGAVDVLAPHVDFFKIASYQLLWDELLAAVGRTRKPVVLATGMATLAEVRAAVALLERSGCDDLTLLHCLSAYPAPVSQANLAAIETLRKAFDCRAGWSDHTRDPLVIERAVRRFGAEMIEFHLDLDGRGAEYAIGHCWLPGEIAWVIRNLERPLPAGLRRSEPSDGDGKKAPRPAESTERQWRTDPSDGLRPLLAMRRLLVEKASA